MQSMPSQRPDAPIALLALTCDELTEIFRQRYGKGAYHARAVYRHVVRHGPAGLGDIPALQRSPRLADDLSRDIMLNPGRPVAEQRGGNAVKLLTELRDGCRIESVIIPMPRHTTLCISSQVGCRMGCRFCETGAMGFVRDLTAEEIVGQVYRVRAAAGAGLKNIVFMGMGEPLDNFEAVVQAIRILSDQRGFNIAHKHITLSTAGHAAGIERLAALGLPRLRLAVSLNAPTDALRSRLMPINRRFGLRALKRALEQYPLCRGGVFFIEYVLIHGINDSRAHARALIRYLEGLPVRLNVIPLNRAADAALRPPGDEQVRRFCGWLTEARVVVRRRTARGQRIMAACGQLSARSRSLAVISGECP